MSRKHYFTHQCGEITPDLVGETLTIAGWVDTQRDHGSLMFLDIRDSTGIIQCVIEDSDPGFPECDQVSLESVVQVTGKLRPRPPNNINVDLKTGSVELRIHTLTILSLADTLPFALHQDDVKEELRLQYRFIDLRRPEMQERIQLRSEIVKTLRQEIEGHGFIEIHTPLLTASSPEGARDYVVPSRLHKGRFFALPQSPQQFKQLLMVSGIHKYYQVAPCFRDEDTRSDRAPGAFYQLDLEMSFATQDNILEIVESVLYNTFVKLSNFKKDTLPFRRISYNDALKKYGSDKPDLRNPLEYMDIYDYLKDNPPNIFNSVIEKQGNIYLLPVENLHMQPRSFFDMANEYAKSLGAGGLGYIYKSPGGAWRGTLVNVLPDSVKDLIEEGGFVIAHGDTREFYRIAGNIRDFIAEKLGLIEKHAFRFCWIVDFPMYERSLDGRIDFSHNPFSMPQGGLDVLNNSDPLDILAWQYDIVCNGVELSSGAVRNHSPEIMYRAFEIAGYTKAQVDSEFGAMINAFKYGAPPHAGCAPGIDRIVMLLAGVENLREIIPFPLTQQGIDLMMNAPSPISSEHLKELGIEITHKNNIDSTKKV
jgi:aspartyl-tRNA synthetase